MQCVLTFVKNRIIFIPGVHYQIIQSEGFLLPFEEWLPIKFFILL
jgi:hypothetical protein